MRFNYFTIIWFLLFITLFSSLNITCSLLCNREFESNWLNTSLPICSLSSDELASGRQMSGSIPRNDQRSMPSWLNLTLARQGQKLTQDNIMGTVWSIFYGLLAVLWIPDIRDVLMFTNASNSNAGAIKRYLRAGVHGMTLLETIFDQNDATLLESIEKVRQVHLNVATSVIRHGNPIFNRNAFENTKTDYVMWDAFEADLRESDIPLAQRVFPANYYLHGNQPLPINQFNQGLTLFAFHSYAILYPENFFLYDATETDMMALMHSWAVIGYGLGTEDEYNVCLQPDLISAKKYYKEIQAKYFTPAHFNTSKETKILIESLISNVNNLIPGLDGRSFMVRYLTDILRIPARNIWSILTPAQKRNSKRFNEKFVPNMRNKSFRTKFNEFTRKLSKGVNAVIFRPYLKFSEKTKDITMNDCPGARYGLKFGQKNRDGKPNTMCYLWKYMTKQ